MRFDRSYIPTSIPVQLPSCRTFVCTTRAYSPGTDPQHRLSLFRHEVAARAQYTRRARFAGIGLIVSFTATVLLVAFYPLPPTKTEAPSNAPSFPTTSAAVVVNSESKVSLDSDTSGLEDEHDRVPTGTASVPFFPRTIYLPRDASSTRSAALPAGTGITTDAIDAYQLLGLGIRTVSFLGIQVYVVGLYVAAADMAALQAALVRRVAGDGASALVGGEKEALRTQLLNGETSAEAWTDVLAHGTWRSALRVVPTRNTDFSHLRDGWVRGLVSCAGRMDWSEDVAFGEALGAFKALFGGRKGVGKGRAMVLGRGAGGKLAIWVDSEGKEVKRKVNVGRDEGWVKLGEVGDERISRGIWLTYLGGKSVASEGARKSIVDGVVEIVERPVGTVETRVI